MTPVSANASASFEQLSALADGELDDSAVGPACASWHSDATQRSTWHAYHLIGDVMRSEDLACDAGRDAAFLEGLRERLAAEPVVLAPQAVVHSSAPARRRRSWMAPAAVAAGFVAVAGVLVVTRGPTAAVPVLAAASAAGGAPARVATSNAPSTVAPAVVSVLSQGADASGDPPVVVANNRLIRDVQLDRYLAAHKQFAGTSALGMPSAFLRAATSDATSR